jgi:hypothetical protein
MAAKLTKRQKTYEGKVEAQKLYPIADALGLVKQCATAKFDESIDVAVQLGIDAKKSDQLVKPNALRCLLKAPKLMKLALRVPISSVWKIWLSKLKPVS